MYEEMAASTESLEFVRNSLLKQVAAQSHDTKPKKKRFTPKKRLSVSVNDKPEFGNNNNLLATKLSQCTPSFYSDFSFQK